MPLAIGFEPMAPAGSIGENSMDLIRHGFEHVLQEFPGCLPVCLVDEPGHGKLACAVDANEQKQFALSALHFGNVPSRACKHALPGSGYGRSRLSTNVSFVCRPTDRVAFELLPLRLVASHVSQSRETVALLAPMQRRACQLLGEYAFACQPTDAGWMAAGHRGSPTAAAACAAEKRQRSPPPPPSGSSSGAL